MSTTRLSIDGGAGLNPDGIGPVSQTIGLVTGSGTALAMQSDIEAATRLNVDGTVAASVDPDVPIEVTIGLVSGTGAPLAVTDNNSVAASIGQVIGVGAAQSVTAFQPANISLVSSSRGTNIIAANETLTVIVDDSTGITGVTVNGTACSLVQIITGTEVTCTVPLGVGAAYGTSVNVVVNNGLNSAAHSATWEPPLGMVYTSFAVDYAGLGADSPFAGDTDFASLSVGDVCIYDAVTTPSGNGVSMSGTGVFTLSGTISIQQQFDYYLYDASDQTVSATIEQITVQPGPVEASIGLVTGAGTVHSVSSTTAITGQIGQVTGVGTTFSVADGSTAYGSIGLVQGVGAPQSVAGGPSQVVAIGLVTGIGVPQSVADGSTPQQEIGLVTGTGSTFPVFDGTAVTRTIGIVAGVGVPQGVSFPATLDSLQLQLDNLQTSVDSLTTLVTAQQALIDEMYIRLDLNVSVPNTYQDDGSEISNSQFTLSRKSAKGSSFEIERT